MSIQTGGWRGELCTGHKSQMVLPAGRNSQLTKGTGMQKGMSNRHSSCSCSIARWAIPAVVTLCAYRLPGDQLDTTCVWAIRRPRQPTRAFIADKLLAGCAPKFFTAFPYALAVLLPLQGL